MSFESRLGNRGRHRARVGASADDYTQPKCQRCGDPISDDRLEAKVGTSGRYGKFCSQRCGAIASQIRNGRGTGRGQMGRWRPVYDAARAAAGRWIVHACIDSIQAKSLEHTIGQRRDFQATRDGAAVSIRLVVA